VKLRKLDTKYHTYADYLTWPEGQNGELIDGTGYVREPPGPSWSHQGIVVELCVQLGAALKGKPWRVVVAPLDVRLPKSNEADDLIDTVVQPDVFIVCDLEKVDERGVRGAPDWVAEVLSPSTVRHDTVRKLAVYERAGVRELWFIHPIKRTLTLYRLEAGRYGPQTILKLEGRTRLTAVPDVTIDWDAVLDRIC